ncbi:hypothetical protein Tco_0347499 [Tanacetum coccineum]
MENLNIPQKVSKVVDEIVTDAVDWAMQAPLRARFSDLPAVDMKEVLQQWMFKDKSYLAHEDHKNLFEALEKSLERDHSNQLLTDLEEARKKKRKKRASPRTPSGSPPSQPPPPPPPTSASGAPASAQQQGSKAPSSSKTTASTPQSMAWTTSDTRYESTGVSSAHESSPTDSLMNEDSIPEEQVHLSNDEDTGNDHLPNADMRKGWWKPLPKEERPATPEPAWTIPSSNISDVENNWASALVSTYEPPAENSLLAKIRDMTTFMNWYCSKVNKTVLTQVDFEGQAYEVVKAFYPDIIHLQFQLEECHKMLTDQINWGNPEGDQVKINVSRPLPLSGPPGHLTIQTKFFFNKDLEYLRYGNKGSRPSLSISKMKAARYPDFGLELLVPEQMWINEVCTYDISAAYGISHWWFNRQKFYIERHDSPSRQREVRNHMRILSFIAEKDFKNLYPSDFEDLNLLLLQGHLDHLSGSEKRWDDKGYEFKHDYTIIENPRAVVFPVNHNEQKIMRFNEIYKFSDEGRDKEQRVYVCYQKAIEDKKGLPELGMLYTSGKESTQNKDGNPFELNINKLGRWGPHGSGVMVKWRYLVPVEKCLKLEIELQKDFVEKEIYDKLFKRFITLKKHCISLEVDTQLNQEIFQWDNSISNQSSPSFDQLFQLNELKAQSQEKDMVIKKLKERIKSLSRNMDKVKIKQDLEEIETINIKLDHREKVLVITTLKDELRKLKGKDLANNEVTHHPSDPEIITEPITAKLLNKRSAHSAYIKHTQEEAEVLRDLVDHIKAN